MSPSLSLLCRIAAQEELLPLKHLPVSSSGPSNTATVKGVQSALQALEEGNYNPLEHSTGALETVQVWSVMLEELESSLQGRTCSSEGSSNDIAHCACPCFCAYNDLVWDINQHTS